MCLLYVCERDITVYERYTKKTLFCQMQYIKAGESLLSRPVAEGVVVLLAHRTRLQVPVVSKMDNDINRYPVDKCNKTNRLFTG